MNWVLVLIKFQRFVEISINQHIRKKIKKNIDLDTWIRFQYFYFNIETAKNIS